MSLETRYSSVEDAVESLPLQGEDPNSRYVELEKNARPRILRDGSKVRVLPEKNENSPRIVGYFPPNAATPETIILGINGYMMPPTAMMTSEILGEEYTRIMDENKIAYLGYSHGQKGKAEVCENNGRTSINYILNQVAEEIKEVLEQFPNTKIILDGHSQGAQIVGHILKSPEDFGIERKRIRGAILRNSIPIPDSTMTWTGKKTVPLAVKNLYRIIKSLITNKGVTFNKEATNDFFFNGEADLDDVRIQRIFEALSPGEGLFFLKTLLSLKGTSPFFQKGALAGTNIAVMSGEKDHLFPPHLQRRTARYLEKHAGANVELWEIPGGHFASILGGDEATKANVGALKRLL